MTLLCGTFIGAAVPPVMIRVFIFSTTTLSAVAEPAIVDCDSELPIFFLLNSYATAASLGSFVEVIVAVVLRFASLRFLLFVRMVVIRFADEGLALKVWEAPIAEVFDRKTCD